MFNKKGAQSINCAVSSCKYHDKIGACSLSTIQVSPCQDCGSGAPDDESMCASYSNR